MNRKQKMWSGKLKRKFNYYSRAMNRKNGEEDL